MKIIFKLTRAEFTALTKMVAGLSQQWPTDDLTDRLLRAMLQRFARDLVARSCEVKKNYRIELHPERALAFAIAIEIIELDPVEFADNLALKLYNQIIQQSTL